jgi:prolyl 4-hydroxylase
MKINTLHTAPLLIEVEEFITPEQCDEVIAMQWGFQEAEFVVDGIPQRLPSRNSSYTFDASNVLCNIRQKIVDFCNPYLSQFDMSDANYEQLSIQRYEAGQRYEPHFDFFNVPWINTPPIENDRIATMIIYLNDGFKGGDTTFPRRNVAVKPKKGNAAYFDYFTTDADERNNTIHGGSEVLEGTKYIITAWIRKYPYC